MQLNRSTIVGILVGDLIRALDLREVSSGVVQRGQWFVHTGPTYFTRQGHDRKRAVIRLGDRLIMMLIFFVVDRFRPSPPAVRPPRGSASD